MSEQHFALMDKVYRRQRHVYDLSRKYFLFGRDRLIRALALKPGDRAVEIGCGTARNLIKTARAYRGACLFGLDASSEMLRSATASVERAGLKDRITLAHGLAEQLSPRMFGLEGPFDHVIFSYSLSMIPDWRGAMRAAANALSVNGHAHIVDFGDLEGMKSFAAKGLRRWLARFHVTPRNELLHAVERAQGQARPGNLTVLSGRYAFVWQGGRENLRELAEYPVAGAPQVSENSP